MSLFGGRDPEWVREELLATGVNCGHVNVRGENDCTVIIQAMRDGELHDGVLAHWRVVHPEAARR